MSKQWWMNQEEHEAYMGILDRMRKLLTEHRALVEKLKNKKATEDDQGRLIRVICGT